MAEWFYIGHYGQLGPLTRDQMTELIEGGVIARDTYVWKSGMTDWLPADRIAELASSFNLVDPMMAPPPPPNAGPKPFAASSPPTMGSAMAPMQRPMLYPSLRSDKSRILAGVLNLFLPGVGRIYLGYAALGVLQIVVSIVTCGLGLIWPFVDGIIILSGGVKLDGYGRQLAE